MSSQFSEFDPSDYGLSIDVTDEVVTVTYVAHSQIIMRGGVGDLEKLISVLGAQKHRMMTEIAEDVARFDIDPLTIVSFSDLDSHLDANIYVSGGRSPDGQHGDEKYDWSDRKTEMHVRAMLASAPIGKGVSAVSADDTSGSESYAGFENALMKSVDSWIRKGGLVEITPAPSP